MGARALREWQIGIESTYGTDVAATRKLYPGAGSTLDKRPALYTPKVDAASYDLARQGRFRQLLEAGGNIVDMPMDTNMLVEILRMALSSTPNSGSAAGAGGAYDWEFTPGDTLASATLEWDASGQKWQAIGTMVDELTIAWGVADPVTISATLIAKDVEKIGSMTGAISAFALAPIMGWEVALYIDAISGTPFTTQKTGTLLGGEITVRNNLKRRYFDDNTQLLNSIGRGDREVSARLMFDLGSNGMTEWDNMVAGTSRLVGLRFGNNNNAGSDSNYKHKVDVILPGVWAAAPPGDQDESSILDMELQNIYSTDQSFAYKFAVRNTRAA